MLVAGGRGILCNGMGAAGCGSSVPGAPWDSGGFPPWRDGTEAKAGPDSGQAGSATFCSRLPGCLSRHVSVPLGNRAPMLYSYFVLCTLPPGLCRVGALGGSSLSMMSVVHSKSRKYGSRGLWGKCPGSVLSELGGLASGHSTTYLPRYQVVSNW